MSCPRRKRSKADTMDRKAFKPVNGSAARLFARGDRRDLVKTDGKNAYEEVLKWARKGYEDVNNMPHL